jgi:hypothetical protein
MLRVAPENSSRVFLGRTGTAAIGYGLGRGHGFGRCLGHGCGCCPGHWLCYGHCLGLGRYP